MDYTIIALISATTSLIVAVAAAIPVCMAYVHILTKQAELKLAQDKLKDGTDIKDAIKTVNAQLKEANTQLSALIKQGSLAANPDDPGAADAEHAVNIAKDKEAAEST